MVLSNEAIASFHLHFHPSSKGFRRVGGCGWAFDTPFAFCKDWASMGPLAYSFVWVGLFVGFIVARWIISSAGSSFVEFARLTTWTYVLVCAALFRSLRLGGLGK